jgi:uncharacterized delta-60 repeat protein
MKNIFMLMLGTVLAVACNQSQLPATTDSSPEAGADVKAQLVFPKPFPTCNLFIAGMLDTTFGNCGRVLTGDPAMRSEGYAIPNVMAIQPDGKVLVAGDFGSIGPNHVVFRLNPNGSLDTSFSGDGFTQLAYQYLAFGPLSAIEVLADGKILLAGQYSGGDASDIFEGFSGGFITRLNSDGSTDTSFNGGAFLKYPLHSFVSIALQPDGKIVTIGGSDSTSTPFQVMRLNPDGSLDFDFQQPLLEGSGWVVKVFVLSSGRIVAVRNTQFGPTATAFDTNGFLDTTFGKAGSIAPWKPRFLFPGYVNTCGASAAIKQTDEKMILVGGCNNQFAMARITPNGGFDLGFGTNGLVSDTSIPTMGAATLRADGRIVVAGGQNNDFLLVGFNANGSQDLSWGNGRVVTGFPNRIGITPVDTVRAVSVAADGKIIAVGSSYTGVDYETDPLVDRAGFAFARYRP